MAARGGTAGEAVALLVCVFVCVVWVYVVGMISCVWCVVLDRLWDVVVTRSYLYGRDVRIVVILVCFPLGIPVMGCWSGHGC